MGNLKRCAAVAAACGLLLSLIAGSGGDWYAVEDGDLLEMLS